MYVAPGLPGKRLEQIRAVKPTEMPLATSIKTHMLKLLHRSKSTRHSRDMVIPNKRIEANRGSTPVSALVDPYPMAIGVVSNGAVRSSLPVPEKKSGSMRVGHAAREKSHSQVRRVRAAVTQVRIS